MVGYNSNIHSASHLAKAILGRTEFIFGGLNYTPDELLVVNYHSTPKKFIDNFREQIQFYKAHFTIISPEDLEAYYKGELKSDKAKLLLSFDDGLKNNLNAIKVLNEYGIKAFFFLVPDFLNCDAAQQKGYYLKNIRPDINSHIDSAEEDFTAMSSADVQTIISLGHVIGSHTYTHTLVASKSDLINSEKEIEKSKTLLEDQFNVRITSFCSINNTLESVGKKEKELIKKNYSFHFTTIPGSNAIDKDPLFIKRRNLECFWMRGAMYYALGKWDLSRWEDARKNFLRL